MKKFKLAALAIPAFAEELNIKSETTQFQPLETLSFRGILSGAISLVLILVSIVFMSAVDPLDLNVDGRFKIVFSATE